MELPSFNRKGKKYPPKIAKSCNRSITLLNDPFYPPFLCIICMILCVLRELSSFYYKGKKGFAEVAKSYFYPNCVYF